MTRLFSDHLQTAIFQSLQTGAEGRSFESADVFDAPPSDALPDVYILIGQERVTDRSDITGGAALHEIELRILSVHESFATAKEVASDVCEVLTEGSLSLASGKLCRLQFRTARAGLARGSDQRLIILKFRAFIDAA